MKILSAAQIRLLDAYTIAHEPITSANLMERASSAFVGWFKQQYSLPRPVVVVCGTGNNGGDGLCIARLLKQAYYKVSVIVIQGNASTTPDFLLNQARLNKLSGIAIRYLVAANEVPNQDPAQKNDSSPLQSDISAALQAQLLQFPHTIVIDALFGSGINRPLQGIYAQAVMAINQSACEVVAVDMPSGLYADCATDSAVVVQARHTVSFELPKLALLLPENYAYVGNWHCVSIQLSADAIAQQDTAYYYLNAAQLLAIQRLEQQANRSLKAAQGKFAHKGSRGHALLIGGSKGKIGALLMAVGAALRQGAGLISGYVPACGNDILQQLSPEAMTLSDPCYTHISQLPENLSIYRAIGIGTGLGQHPDTASALKALLNSASCSLVIDADALNIIAAQGWQHLVPPNSILTPHPKEFERLAGASANDFERLMRLQQLAKQIKCFIALKGAHTAMACPDGQVFFNSTGNSAMAVGGSGDVLTGIITAYLAQGHSPKSALLTGVFRHGQMGDMAAQNSKTGCITARDLYL